MIAELSRAVEELGAGVAELRRRLGRNSRNSPMPPSGTKKYVQAAVTESCSLFFPGARSLESFREFGILPVFAGVAVSDRYLL
jgi:hypothetical protein